MPMSFFRPRPSGGPLGAIERPSLALGAESLSLEAARLVKPQPIPFEPKRPLPYRLDLADVIGEPATETIRSQRRLVFHTIGDSGGIKDPKPQSLVARGLERSFNDTKHPASFLYHLGDVVYYRGETDSYFDQFYDAYEHYPAPIFAIPGNHDGQVGSSQPRSLAGFERNFCAEPETYTEESVDTQRMAMCQPYAYWCLDTPLAYFIGLYTNVPEGGHVDDAQKEWLQSQLSAAPDDKALFLALHHPVYSFDSFHSGSSAMARIIESAINSTKRVPNMILAAHVHNYQRIEKANGKSTLPFLVIGNGGYFNLHELNVKVGYADPGTSAKLVAGIDSRHGFATLEVTPERIEGFFTTVPRPQESWSDPAGYVQADHFAYPAKPIRLGSSERIRLVPA
jgi:acid phosphatase type 7